MEVKTGQRILARMSHEGWGEPKDLVKAYYYRLLAEQDKGKNRATSPPVTTATWTTRSA